MTRPQPATSTSSPGSVSAHVRKLRGRARGPRLGLRIGVPTFLAAMVVGGVLSLEVPFRTPGASPEANLEELVRKGPDSYFHHIFDPNGLLGQLGQLDLTLDNFERETGHGVLLAALPHAPEDASGFAMHAAEVWQPGVKGADDGVIVFVFPTDRLIRVDVGYGVEPALPDAEVRRLVSATLVPAARDGDISSGMEALVPQLLDRLRSLPRAQGQPRAHLSDVLVSAQEIPRRARIARTAWLAGPLGLRFLITALAAILLATFAVLLARIATSTVMLGRRLHARRDAARLRQAGVELANSLLSLAQVVVILFVMVVGTSFFFPGTGTFGGAGVLLPW